MNYLMPAIIFTLSLLSPHHALGAEALDWPRLPASNDTVTLPAQDWAFQERPRSIQVYIYYPGKSLANVNKQTGLMLSLHNWAGTNAISNDPHIAINKRNIRCHCGGRKNRSVALFEGRRLSGYDAICDLYRTREADAFAVLRCVQNATRLCAGRARIGESVECHQTRRPRAA